MAKRPAHRDPTATPVTPAAAAPATGSPAAGWAAITWHDLERWAGARSVERGRTYQRQGRVRDLAAAADGRLVATVTGGDRYDVTVALTGSADTPVRSRCTCPVGSDGCKHAVATVTEHLDRITRGKPVPPADPDDPRWREADADDEAGDKRDGEDDAPPAQTRRRASGRTRDGWDGRIDRHVRGKTREELADLVCSLVKRFPELRDEFRERIALAEGDADRLIAEARKELKRATAKPGWHDGWGGGGHTPDYDKLVRRLERLLELGQADPVAQLGRELIDRGMAQVGSSNDEGETATALSEALRVVFDAAARSSMSPPQKLLFAIDAILQDDYDLIGDAAEQLLDAEHEPSDWSAVADELAARVAGGSGASATAATDDDDDDDEDEDEDEDEEDEGDDDRFADDFSRGYHRDLLTGWLAEALTRAGRGDEVLALYEREARATNSYQRLVRLLVERERYDDAVRWAAEGIAKTAERLPGIAADLAHQARDVAERRKEWDVVAAHAALTFFGRPSRSSFDELAAAAEKAGCGDAVRGAALRFLETGIPPMRVAEPKVMKPKPGRRPAGRPAPVKPAAAAAATPKITTAAGWPLKLPEYLLPLMRSDARHGGGAAGPHYDVLIDMAIADGRTDDVLRWYDHATAAAKPPAGGGGGWGAGWGYGPRVDADRVAEAVAASHPRRALEIYTKRLEQALVHASASAYESAATYLRRMLPVLRTIGRERDWKQLVAAIRLKHKNRPRLLETLDKLEDRPIVAAPRRGA